jgi:hypothetical protein
MANMEKLHTVAEIVFALPEKSTELNRWNQDVWMDIALFVSINHPAIITDTEEIKVRGIKCQTAGCFAGHTALIYAPVGTKLISHSLQLPGSDEWIPYDEWAAEELDLTASQAHYLFSSDRTKDGILDFIADLDA